MAKDSFDPDDLHQRSYHLGMIYAFAECVGSGVKKLALSPPLDEKEFENIKRDIECISEEFDIVTYVDRSFLETLLFNPEYTKGKIVIHLANNRGTIDRYLALKKKKMNLARHDNLNHNTEKQIAWEMGRLLSYSDAAIRRLIKNPRFEKTC